MRIDYKKINRASAEVVHNHGVAAVVLPEENGFRKLIAYFCMKNGEYAWIHSAFRLRNRNKKNRKKQ